MTRRLRVTMLFLGFLVAVFGGVCITMELNQGSFVYFPERGYEITPAALGFSFKEVRLKASDGVGVAAWWIPAADGAPAAVFAHGNGGNMSHRLDKVRYLHDLGYSVLIFDYRGYGASEGTPSEAGTYSDMTVAVDHVLTVRGIAPERLVLYGESLGGAVAVEEAIRRRPAALVVESSFTSIPEMARHYYPWIPARILLDINYDSLSRVGRLKCPVFVLHSPEDDVVPYAMGRALYDACPQPKRFAVLQGGHNTGGLLASPDARRDLAAFLAEILARP